LATPDQLRERIRQKSKLKGRQADDISRSEVVALLEKHLGQRPETGYRRDLLIENLHVLNDAYRGLHERHLVALAKEMNIPMAEVYEVATFYHHFEVIKSVKQGDETVDGTAPALTIRVCDGLSCELAGAQDLLKRLPGILGNPNMRVVAAPCLGRCEQAPAVAVHQRNVPYATLESVKNEVNIDAAGVFIANDAINFITSELTEKSISPHPTHPSASAAPAYTDYATYLANGGYALAGSIANGSLEIEPIIKAMEDSGLRGLGGAGFPVGS
jgi:formate dehydrogenase